MGLFDRLSAGSRAEAGLGRGVWRRVHGRFQRGLDRFHQMLEGIEDQQLQCAVLPLADCLVIELSVVRGLCCRAQELSPSENFELPQGGLIALHRELSMAANALATAAEALAMLRLGEAEIEAVRRRVKRVAEHVKVGKQILESAERRASR